MLNLRRRLCKLERAASPRCEETGLEAQIAAALALPTENERCVELLRLHQLMLSRESSMPRITQEDLRPLLRLPHDELVRLHGEALGLSDGKRQATPSEGKP
jgi:hypothetical protein